METGDIIFNGNLAVSHNAITNGLDFVELSSGGTLRQNVYWATSRVAS